MSVQQPLTASLEDVAAATMTMMKKMMKLSDYLAHTVGLTGCQLIELWTRPNSLGYQSLPLPWSHP